MLNSDDLLYLALLRDLGDDGDLIREGRVAFLGDDPVPATLVDKFLRMMAITSIGDEGSKVERYKISSTGKQILYNPEIQSQIIAAILDGGAFTIDGGRVSGI